MNYQATKSMVHQKRGITLLIAVLISAVVLAVGMGVYQRIYKELYFSSFWKQTQLALATADSGLECVLYWDLHPSATPSCFNTAIPTWVAVATVTYDPGTYMWGSLLTPRCAGDTDDWDYGAVQFVGADVGAVCYDQYSLSGSVSLEYTRAATGGASAMPSGSFQLDTYGGCVNVTITKPAPSGASTLIEARGYNNTCATITSNIRTVERGLNIEY
ncbi:MAG: hypothetical protein A2937_01705 [Candidatus Yonathbacteria bacterium RIFCSPLOWO2_01_FULL_47_33b]|uniref:Type 4 fimbrial biogenesis protein PilX N-terminal domain-containing protein n=1 Tax=Candidatus Yonathbacteria bacterium RIFCSPLOWO2_01_FULL_47_33b TaxID=1802727 RepID=A0A1G2SJ35_9BACT|nr:MAG: hypothetical protein A2937_01705 [Candidatus Yonathbacteria bacterium RIFCSPLOWO2_01_FULL_47_33b]